MDYMAKASHIQPLQFNQGLKRNFTENSFLNTMRSQKSNSEFDHKKKIKNRESARKFRNKKKEEQFMLE